MGKGSFRRNGNRWIIGGLALVLAATGGCASPGKGTGIGAGAGAGVGAAIGGAAGGWKGAAIGALAGGAIGAAAGNTFDRQAQQLAQVAETKRTQEGILVNLKNDLLFDTGSDVLRPDAVEQLANLGGILSKYPDDRIRIEGYTDSTGSPTFNEELSQRRAQAVRNVLVDHGVTPSQLLVVGMGESHPVASNQSSAGRSQNRRVELHITSANQQQAGTAGGNTAAVPGDQSDRTGVKSSSKQGQQAGTAGDQATPPSASTSTDVDHGSRKTSSRGQGSATAPAPGAAESGAAGPGGS